MNNEVSILARTEVRALRDSATPDDAYFAVSILARTEVRALQFAYNVMTINVEK
jgi:hypothetical protein